MTDDEKPEGGFHNQHPANARRFGALAWSREHASKAVPGDLAADGWRPMCDVPNQKYVAFFFRGGTTGHYAGAAAYYLEDQIWRVAHSKMIFDTSSAIAWKPWTKQRLEAEPSPPKGRKG